MSRPNSDRDLGQLFDSLAHERAPDALRERLQADVHKRFLEAQPTRAGRLLRSRPALAGAALVAAACVVVAFLNVRGNDVLGAALEAMAQVKTMHAQTPSEEYWISVDHGVRIEKQYEHRSVTVCTAEGTWEYDAGANTFTASDPVPDVAQAFLTEVSGLVWLEQLRLQQTPYTVTDVELDGRPAKLINIESEASEDRITLWLDSETMLVIEAEEFRTRGGEHVVAARTRIEYDVQIDPAIFTLDPPEGARVVDSRLDESVSDLIKAATEAVRALPLHEVGEGAPTFMDEGRKFDEWHTWEAWRQNAVGYREEHDGRVDGGTTRVRWQYTDRDGYITEQEMNPKCQPPILGWLESLPRAGSEGPVGERRPVEVTTEERNGAPFVRIACYRTDSPPKFDERPTERQRREYLFDAATKRITEFSVYVLVDDDWKLAEYIQYQYPDQLPEAIFEPNPPPGLRMDDQRKR